jgi:hypothetical protein
MPLSTTYNHLGIQFVYPSEKDMSDKMSSESAHVRP